MTKHEPQIPKHEPLLGFKHLHAVLFIVNNISPAPFPHKFVGAYQWGGGRTSLKHIAKLKLWGIANLTFQNLSEKARQSGGGRVFKQRKDENPAIMKYCTYYGDEAGILTVCNS